MRFSGDVHLEWTSNIRGPTLNIRSAALRPHHNMFLHSLLAGTFISFSRLISITREPDCQGFKVYSVTEPKTLIDTDDEHFLKCVIVGFCGGFIAFFCFCFLLLLLLLLRFYVFCVFLCFYVFFAVLFCYIQRTLLSNREPR